MKVELEIKDSKAAVFLEFIKSLDFVSIKKEKTSTKAVKEKTTTLAEDIEEAVAELNLIKQGKLKARNAEELIDEL